jgi:DNA repair exonuclease SbcCD ATPase subunit
VRFHCIAARHEALLRPAGATIPRARRIAAEGDVAAVDDSDKADDSLSGRNSPELESAMIGLAVFVALVAVLAAVAMFLQSRSSRQLALDRAGELEKLRREAESARSDLSAARADAKGRREEANALRGELSSAKKKAFEQAEAVKKSGGAMALRAEIDKLTTRLAEARAEATHQADRARSFELALEKQAKDLERAREAADRKPEPPVATPAPVPAPPAAPAGVDPARLEAERERADRTEAKLAEARKRVAELEKELKAARGRLETEKRVYMVQKGELELANDRHAELRRRHEALRKDHDELLDAVRQAAQEERRLAESEKKTAQGPETKPAEGSVA